MTAPIYNFDAPIDRRHSDAIKWNLYPEDVLPLWVADMDFKSPQPVVDALHQRVEHGLFGYVADAPELRELIVNRMQRLYQWTIQSQEIVFFPGIVPALFMVDKVFAEPGDNILAQTPVYPPFLSAPGAHEQKVNAVPLVETRTGKRLHYTIDFEAFEAAINPQTRVFMLCNPHNPVGRAFSRDELTRLAEICLKHGILIASDEIHCDLMLDNTPHIPIASLSPEISARTVTLMAPSKTFNIAGLGCSFAIIQDEELRKKLAAVTWGQLPFVNALGYVAATAAYRDGQQWLDELLVYLQANRDYLVDFVEQYLPGIAITCPEATYLAWLDFRSLNLPDNNAQKFLLEQAKIGLNDGKPFGDNGQGFVRLNFACPRAILVEALNRMRAAIEALE
ncbi:MAG TPA: PatB family C-S lyase [Phototrophicaceae bacterium]|jgi:cystathionine beta-lyase|nr:PatB family C-S lyase [Phototrophicaceae bacterium]